MHVELVMTLGLPEQVYIYCDHLTHCSKVDLIEFIKWLLNVVLGASKQRGEYVNTIRTNMRKINPVFLNELYSE